MEHMRLRDFGVNPELYGMASSAYMLFNRIPPTLPLVAHPAHLPASHPPPAVAHPALRPASYPPIHHPLSLTLHFDGRSHDIDDARLILGHHQGVVGGHGNPIERGSRDGLTGDDGHAGALIAVAQDAVLQVGNTGGGGGGEAAGVTDTGLDGDGKLRPHATIHTSCM